MAKKLFKLPTVLLAAGWGGDGDETGGGSAGTSDDITACDYSEWLEMYGDDYDLDDDIDFDDYRTWWIDNNLSEDTWDVINPDTPLNP